MSRSRSLAVAAGLVAFAVVGCASGSGSKQGAESASAPKEAAAEKAKPPQGVPPPAGTRLAKVQMGWNDEQVRAAIGAPDNVEGYITGKSFIPFYYGTDTSRTDWEYKSEGRVVFSRNAYSGTLKVIRIDYDPNELAQ